jgi:hypothetical protein
MKLRPKKNTNKTSGMILGTTALVHSDDVINSLAFRYLKLAYPVLRNKINGKFKRTIFVNERLYLVSTEKTQFLQILINNVSSTFGLNQYESKLIIFDYFKIKNHQ